MQSVIAGYVSMQIKLESPNNAVHGLAELFASPV